MKFRTQTQEGVAITKALAGYTRISYNGEEIAKHYLSATTQGTREAFEIPEEESVISWLENNFADEIKAIDEAQEEGIENGEELVTLYRVFGYFYTEQDGQAWSPYLKRNIPCQVWNDNKELSKKTMTECSIKSFNTKDLKDVMINYSTSDKVCLVAELQSCLVPKRVWDWAKGINEKKISKERKETHFAYENGGQDLDEYICNEVNYDWKSTGIAFRLDGNKLPENEMKEVFDYFDLDTKEEIVVS